MDDPIHHAAPGQKLVELAAEPHDRVVRFEADPGGLFGGGHVVEFAAAKNAMTGQFSKSSVATPKQYRAAGASPFAIAKQTRRLLKVAGIRSVRTNDPLAGSAVYRDPTTGKPTIRTQRGPGAIPAFLHEAGHLVHPDKAALRKYNAAAADGRHGDAALADMAVERAANKGARGIIRQAGGSRATENAYLNAVRPGYSSYRNAAANALVREQGMATEDQNLLKTASNLLRSGAAPDEVGRVLEKLRKRTLPGYSAAKRQVSRANREEFRKFFSSGARLVRYIETQFARRDDDDSALDRTIDATSENLPRPEKPAEVSAAQKVLAKLKDSPAARALKWRLIQAGAGAAIGGTIGYRTAGRKGIRPGIKAGAIGGLLFSDPAVEAAVLLSVNQSLKLKVKSLSK